MSTPLAPGATIGILGSGQLGRMFAAAARRLGYRVHVYSPEPGAPAAQLADTEVVGDYDDLPAVLAFARDVDVVTLEFENVPAATVEAIQAVCPVYPDAHALAIAQHRVREKTFLAAHGVSTGPWVAVQSFDDLVAAIDRCGVPGVLKTATSGYDGKGQVRIDRPQEAQAAWAALQGREAIYEAFIDLAAEFSVIGARSADGSVALYPAVRNVHRHHILDVSVAPADLPRAVTAIAETATRAVLDALAYVGVLCIEFFLASDGRVLVNEMAPRPHNSGHLTIEACAVSQFEMQLRAVCGWPLAGTHLRQPAAMVNLLGDLWAAGEPRWASLLREEDATLHLYGKSSPRPGRKMGHVTVLAATAADAESRAHDVRRRLSPTAATEEDR